MEHKMLELSSDYNNRLVELLNNQLTKIKKNLKSKAPIYTWHDAKCIALAVKQLSDPINSVDKVVADTCGSNLESYKEMLEGVLENKEPFKMHHSELEKTVDDVNRMRNKIEHLKYVTDVYKGYQKERQASMWRMKSNSIFQRLYILDNMPRYNSSEHKAKCFKQMKSITKQLKSMFKLYNGFEGDITQEYFNWTETQKNLENSIVKL
jgi:molecular chaperone GrpE (heat shock protein)